MNKKIFLSAFVVIIIVIAAIFIVVFLRQNFTNENLKLVITPDREVYARGETISIHGQIKNLSEQELYFYTTESSLVTTFKIFDSQGHEIEAAYAIDDPPLPELKDFALIRSGESLSKEFKIFIPEENIKSQGMYSITTIYKVWQNTYFNNHKQVKLNAWTGTLKSNTIKIEIKFSEEKKPKPVANVAGKSCEIWHQEIEQNISDANYCALDSDCQVLDREKYTDFGCFALMNNTTNKNALYTELDAYLKKCNQEPTMFRECMPAPKTVCVSNKCVFPKDAFDPEPVDEQTRVQKCIEGCGVGYCADKAGCDVPGYRECVQICER